MVRALSLLLLLLSASLPAQGPGISQALAQTRAARLSHLAYKLHYTLLPGAATTAATETLTFTDSGSGDLPLDFRDGTLTTANLNTHPFVASIVDGHLTLPAASLVHGTNTLELAFSANLAAAGKAITRYTDKDDQAEYLYTLFVPMDADMAFPCFDQPDLKAAFTLTLTHPATWQAIANTAATQVSPTETSFPATRPISTYLFAFAAGPFARIAPAHPGEPALYVRRSQLARARSEAPQVQEITRQGIAWLADYFAQPFPFPKYDLVLLPGFPFGGMEHAGATFLNEDGVLFRSAPTEADYFHRNTLVLHETTHQWFGDLVTMRWFDDLWLKEGFAQYMAYRALAALVPAQQPFKHFYEDIEPLAYAIDETHGTTPIFQQIPNLADAKSAYGAIVYQKAPAVLKQLEYYVGADTFRQGLRLYLAAHAYANATWPDLIHALEAASPDAPAGSVQHWADAWILRPGMPEITTDWSCTDGRLDRLTLTQHDVLDPASRRTWPIANELLLVSPLTRGVEPVSIPVRWDTPTYPVAEATGKPCPQFVFANSGDHAYGRFLLDPRSAPVVTQAVSTRLGITASDPLLHTMLWGALWDSVHVAQASPADYATLALRTLSAEPDESLNRIQGARVATTLHAYLAPAARARLVPIAEQVFGERMQHAPSAGLRLVNFHTFTGIAETPTGLEVLRHLLDPESAQAKSLDLRLLDRWNVVSHLLAIQPGEATPLPAATASLVERELARDRSGEAQKYAYAAQAGIASAATKSDYFTQYLTYSPGNGTKLVQEDWLTQSLRPFNSWNQSALTLPYLGRALDALPGIKAQRKIFFLGAWLSAFVDGQHTPEAQAIVHAWLSTHTPDPDLRRKILEQSDQLDRTVLIRQRYPQ